jgi:opacity protein-like surface antigen
MKKLLLTASALVLGMSISTAANADCNGIYLGLRAGGVKHDYSKSSSFNMKGLDEKKFMMSGAIGYRYNYWRTELEYVWRDRNKWEKSTGTGGSNRLGFKSYSYMWNNYIDFAPYYWISPYVSGGLGFTKMKYTAVAETAFGPIDQTSWFNNTPTKFTWSLGGGLTVKVTNRFNVDAGYRYYDMGNIHKMGVHAHEIYGGIRYVF